MMNINRKNIIFSIFVSILVLTLVIRIYDLSFFFNELDDLLVPYQLLIYENYNLYDIANSISSNSYNSPIKIILRKVQSLDNNILDNIVIFFSEILFNLAPSKNSTYAPLQYFLFGWLIDINDSYEDLKFYSRLPSVIFFCITIIITFLISKKVFISNIFSILPCLLVTMSMTLLYISQKSYPYSAGVAGFLGLIYILIIENEKRKDKNFIVDDKNISLKKNFYFSILLSLLSYLSYVVLIFVPCVFLLFFIKNCLNTKTIISKFNINLSISGFFYCLLILPLIMHFFNLDLFKNGSGQMSSGYDNEYRIPSLEKNNYYYEIIYFYLKNTVLIISKNLSFFLDNFILSKILQFFLVVFFLIGCAFFLISKNQKIKYFFIISWIFYIYWCFLVFFEIASLGPTRHTIHFTPIFAIITCFGLLKIILFKKKNLIEYISIVFISIFFVFFVNYLNYRNIYKDNFNEKELNQLINNHNVKLIVNSDNYSASICLMNKIKIEAYQCRNRFERIKSKPVISKNELKTLKKENSSILLINFFKNQIIDEKPLDQNIAVYKMLNNLGFKEIYNLNKTTYIKNSPQRISEMTPNPFEIKIYK